jgi:glutathione S-transferase
MSLTFYYAPMSTASLTDLVIEELGIPVKRIKLDLKAGDTKKPEFLKLNPNGKVPLIVHDDTPIFESSAITMYLGEQFGVEKKLYPAPGPKRGEAMKWITWSNVTLGDSIYSWCRNTQEWLPADHRNAKAGEAAKTAMHANLKILDQALAGKQFLLGEFTLADAHVNSLCDWVRHMQVDFSPYADLNAWTKRCSERPAYQRQLAASR